jgi:myo-inositol-1-phosphate synthase
VSQALIPIAIIGVGNCAKSLVEGIAHYRDVPEDRTGLRHPLIGRFAVQDIEVVAAFDIDRRKVGHYLHDALRSQPNCTASIGDLLETNVVVLRGPTCDSVIPELTEFYIDESPGPPVDVTQALLDSGAEIVVNYLPTGSNQAARHYAEAALAAGCSFVNCMPASLMRDAALRARFQSAGAILLGDDIKSQLGATVLNRTLLELLHRQGAQAMESSQKNHGGNADHFNLQFRAQDKEESKKSALISALSTKDAVPDVGMVYEESLFDHKHALLNISAVIFGHAPVRIQVTLEDEDSPNSAGIVVDGVRAAKLLGDARLSHLAIEVCPALMKAPPFQVSEQEGETKFTDAIIHAEMWLRDNYMLETEGPLDKRK